VIGPKSRFAPQKPQFPQKRSPDYMSIPHGKRGWQASKWSLSGGLYSVQAIHYHSPLRSCHSVLAVIMLYIRGLASTNYSLLTFFLESRMITISLIRGQAMVPVARHPTASFAVFAPPFLIFRIFSSCPSPLGRRVPVFVSHAHQTRISANRVDHPPVKIR
jgi:hypothetical protein